jgi:hypothetical protein
MTNQADPALEPAAHEGEHDPDLVARVLERVEGIEALITGFQQRSAHREAVIDRLHEENQQLRVGLSRAILEPAVTDLIRLHGALAREAGRLERLEGTDGGLAAPLLAGFASDVEMILDRCGVERFSAEPGEAFRPGEHEPLAVVPTTEPERHGTVAEVVAPGFRERDTGRVRRPVQARFHKHVPDPTPEP